MSSFISPLGPEPPTVYWIRRGAIILIVVTVVVGAWWLIGALRSGSGTDAASPAASPSAEAQATDEASSDDVSASPEPTGSTDVVECVDSVILVEASTDASTYTVGSTPKLTLTITNSGDLTCTRDVGPKANELEITSGGYHVWSSDDCNASGKSKITTLAPGDTVASSITWNGRLSQKGCPDGEGSAAKAGRYDLVGRNGTVTSDQTPFALTNDN